MKYVCSFTEHINTKDLSDLYVDKINVNGKKIVLPSVGLKTKYKTEIINDIIEVLSIEFDYNEKYDYIVMSDGTLIIGISHYNLSNKSEVVKSAGELMINENGKIKYLNNNSGHYKPSTQHLQKFVKILSDNNLLSQDVIVDYIH